MIKKVIKEELSKIELSDEVLRRDYWVSEISWNTVSKYVENGYKPYKVDKTIIEPIKFSKGHDLKNLNGNTYFFKDNEMVILNKLSSKITEIKGQYKEMIKLWDKYLVSFIETSGKI
tara:strand:- start:112 stop:462 length:351 start_codon:yes stop_codon:yes gene_type:complete